MTKNIFIFLLHNPSGFDIVISIEGKPPTNQKTKIEKPIQ